MSIRAAPGREGERVDGEDLTTPQPAERATAALDQVLVSEAVLAERTLTRRRGGCLGRGR